MVRLDPRAIRSSSRESPVTGDFFFEPVNRQPHTRSRTVIYTLSSTTQGQSMTPQEYHAHVDWNTRCLKEMLTTRSCDFSQFRTFRDNTAPENIAFYCSKTYDLVASAAAGCLIYTAKHGADAVYLDPRSMDTAAEFVDVELKFAQVDSRNVYRSSAGSLYLAASAAKARYKNTRSCLRSGISAKYALHSQDNRQSKNMLTMLVVFDLVNNRILDTFCASGASILAKLNLSDNTKRSVKLSHFINEGYVVPREGIAYGYEKWENELRQTCPVIG